MPEYSFNPRDIIFRENEAADHAFVIRSGEVEILKHGSNGEIRLATLGAGDVFGEMALFDLNATRSATARAVIETVVDAMDVVEFEDLFHQCPPRILPIIRTILERLRSSNRRLSEKEQASVVFGSEIERILIQPATDVSTFQPVTALTAHLPFRIGAYGAEGENNKNKLNHLNLYCDSKPMRISRQHCQIEIIDNALFLNDMGSRYGTILNGHPIGRGKGKYRMPLQKGNNEVILGNVDSPYKILMICE